MRTKLILTTAALGVASSLGAYAQVYSVNAVGYINITVPANGLALIANQLNNGGNTIAEVLPSVADGTTIYRYSQAGGFAPNSYFDGDGWDAPSASVAPGSAFFVQNPTANPITLTFVGEVPQGTLTTPLLAGLNLVASQVPQAGGLQAVLGFVPADGDTVYTWNGTAYSGNSYFAGDGWDFGDPSIAVGQGFWVSKSAAGSWTRTFSVN
ncbi:MAG: hypothetical protein KF833_06910 [Verrucomicrobiae bacterium]|nr:hypothetical protein [Verrucomicrobiae bacterium]